MKNQPPQQPPSLPQTSSESRDALYRPCVGMALFNKQGQVLIAQRLDGSDAWQMPQGGIDPGEIPEIAVFREMHEEIGTRDAEIIGMLDEWLYYDLPPATAKRLWDGKYKGQRQRWIALRFLGQDSDIRLDAFDVPEFGAWKWIAIEKLVDYAIPFKRDIYARVAKEFGKYAVKS